MSAMGFLSVFQEQIVHAFGVAMPELAALIVIICVQIALSIITVWGIACVLLVGRKLVQSRAGRTRSSFGAVRREAAGYVARLFLTGILRDCITILWGLLLIVPGVIYAIRTAFYSVIIIDEETAYRDALKRSRAIVDGHTLLVFFAMLGMTIVVFAPPLAFLGAIAMGMKLAQSVLPVSDLVLDIIVNAVLVPIFFSPAITLYTLGTMALYAIVKKLPQQKNKSPAVFTEVRPE